MIGEASRCGGYVERPYLLGKVSQALTYNGEALQGAVGCVVAVPKN